jgi:hypothetical protein
MLIHQEAIAAHNVLVQVPGDGIVGLPGDIPRGTAANSWVGVTTDPRLYKMRGGLGVHISEEGYENWERLR